jgi:uncharacterized repeat protein (TIGR01451 family)
MYRHSELEWDIESVGDRYLTSTPHYFHGFFRLLGLHVLSGNHHAPMNMKAGANMKVYLDVDKTYAFEGDTITYTVDYRNYGAADAQNVVITNRLHNDFVFVSGTNGAAYNSASHAVEWKLGTVPGFKTSTGINPTKGTMTFKIFVPYANLKRYENSAEITCSNGSGWVSNEYPNKISSIMKRNGFDIARRALRADFSVHRDTVNPGMTATYTINFENSAEAGWLNGGRPGVNFSYAHSGTEPNGGSHTFMLRAFNDAHEAYVDYGNYRISYFVFDNNYKSLGQGGWQAPVDVIYPREAESNVRLQHEMITPGEDARGKWNQRLIMQISSIQTDTNWITMAAPSQFLINYSGLDQRVHRGTSWPFKAVWRLHANYANRSWGGDWSFNPQAKGDIANDIMANWGFPVSPDFTESYDPDYQGKPVTSLHRKLCAPPPATVIDNVLIEEWDGYTWRRVFGNGPIPGREVTNVVIRDTLPTGVTFKEFVGANPLGVEPKYNAATRVITWEIDKLLVGQGGKIQYTVTADTPPVSPVRIFNRAWISGDRESPISNTAVLVITLDSLPPLPPEPTTMYKTADRESYSPEDTISYTIAYKQTHGYTAKSTSNSQWAGSNLSISSDGETVNFGASNVNMRFTPSYGRNVTLTGTVNTVMYVAPVYIFGRNDNNGNSVELSLMHTNVSGTLGIVVTVTSNGTVSGDFMVPAESPASLDYKLVFKADSLLIWLADTTTVLPYSVHTGIGTQSGYAGVRYESTGWGSQSLTGWQTHTDLAYNVTVRDTIPFGVRYVDGSAAGRINTGTLAPKQLTASVSNNVITWPVVSGMNIPQDGLGANDSLTVTWKAVVDTAKNRTIINTAYTVLAGLPPDSIGAQLRSRFVILGDTTKIDTTEIDTSVVPPDTGLYVTANPRGCIFTDSIVVSLSAFIDSAAVDKAKIHYTINGSTPNPLLAASEPPVYIIGEPRVFYATTTLKAMAIKYDTIGVWAFTEESPVITHTYERLGTVPVKRAAYFGDAGDGLAYGVKLALNILGPNSQQPNIPVIWNHIDLIDITGITEYDYIELAGDTLTLFFKKGIPVPVSGKLTIREPQFPGSEYTSAHGYLAAAELIINNDVIPKEPPQAATIYDVRVGPNPFKRDHNVLNIIIDPNPFPQSLDANVRIYDRLGNTVAASGENLKIDKNESQKRYECVWDGTNRRRRFVGNGTYLVYIVITEPGGEKKTFKHMVYFRGR